LLKIASQFFDPDFRSNGFADAHLAPIEEQAEMFIVRFVWGIVRQDGQMCVRGQALFVQVEDQGFFVFYHF
jgi:hypothetical protein